MNIIEHTGNVIYSVLKEQGVVLAQQLQDEVQMLGGEPAYIPFAAKMLRDHGIPVATHRRGRHSEWFIAEDAEAGQKYVQQELKNMLSEAVSIARSSNGIHGVAVKAARDRAKTNAIVLGERLGYSPEEVMDMCKPLPPLQNGENGLARA